MDKQALLLQQNSKLASNLEEKKRECKQLESKLAVYEQKEKDYHATVLCVRRLWDQLHGDLLLMCSDLVPASELNIKQEQQDDKEDSHGHSDPFLARLLAGADANTQQAVQDTVDQIDSENPANAVERVLQARCNTTKQALARLLDAIRSLQASTAGGTEGAGTPPSSMQAQLDALAGQRRVLQERCSQLSDQLLGVTEKHRKLEDEAADLQQALSNVQRKLHTLQSNSIPIPQSQDEDSGSQAQRASTGAMELDEDSAEVLAKRTAELEKEQEAHMQTKRLLTEAQHLTGEDSTWVVNTQAYKALQAELQAAQEALAARTRDVELLISDKEQADARATDRNILALREQQLGVRLAELTNRWNVLSAAKDQADQARLDAETALLQERQRHEGSSTAAELRHMVTVLQSQLAIKEQQLTQARVPAERIEACTQEAMQAHAAIKSAQLARDDATQQAAELGSKLQEGKEREEALQERVIDMQAFVDVLSAYCGDAAAEALAAAQSQVAVLQARCGALQSQLDGYLATGTLEEARKKETDTNERLAKAQAQAYAAHAELAAARTRLEELQQQLNAAKNECQLYIKEIEMTSSAYEDMSAQNQRVLGLLAEKEERAGSLSADKLKLEAAVQRLEEGIGMLQSEVEALKRQCTDAGAVKDAAEREMARLTTELTQVREQLRLQGLRCTTLEGEVRRQEEAARQLGSQLEGARTNLAALNEKLADESERSQRDRNKRNRLEEDNKLLNSKLAKLRKAGGGSGAGGPSSSKELQDEVEAMRKLLNCSVCHERQKNVIISKCCHVFCDKCIKRNLESRNRKCPGCGAAFGQADVRQFFFT